MTYPAVRDPVLVPQGTPTGTLFVDVGDSWGVGAVNPMTNRPRSLKDCARGDWAIRNLNAAHGQSCDYLMARLKGKICGAWRIDRKKGWRIVQTNPDRASCDLIDDPWCRQFLGQRVRLGRCPNSLRGYFI